MGNEIFKKLPQSEKKEVIKGLLADKVEFVAKGKSDDIIYFIIHQKIDEKYFQIHLTRGSSLNEPEALIVNFSHGTGRYFSQINIERHGFGYKISLDVDIFYLQRRRAPRILIPSTYPAKVHLSEVQDQACFVETELLDFSASGCRLKISGSNPMSKKIPAIQTEQKIHAHFHLSHKKPIELDLMTKHTQSLGVDQVIGAQFLIPSTILENRLLVIFMDLQRDIFFKAK